MISSTQLNGSYVIRLCPLNYRTEPSDIEALLKEVETVGERERAAGT